MSVAAQIVALARQDLSFYEFAGEFCKLAAGNALDDGTILHLLRLGVSYHRPVDLPDKTCSSQLYSIVRVSQDFHESVSIVQDCEEQSNQGIKDSSDLDESDGSVFVPSVEESTDDDGLDSEESEVEKTIRKTIKDTIFNSPKEVKKAKQKSARKITIKTSQRNPEGKHIWNKKQYCVFCEKAQSKIAKHLERSHSNESEVAKALSFPKHSKKQRIPLEQLRKLGNYYHNIKVLETGRGEIVTGRQPTADADISDFLPCPDCLTFFMKKDLRKH